jgi:type IV pilus assembly protein PilQ
VSALCRSAKPAERRVVSIRDYRLPARRRRRRPDRRRAVEPNTGIDIRQQGDQLLVDFVRTRCRATCSGRWTSAISPRRCVSIDTFAAGRQRADGDPAEGTVGALGVPGREPLHPRDQAGHRGSEQADQGSRPGYKGDKLSLNFQNVEVRSVLQVIADFTGLNIITSDTVQGNLTLRLKDIPWDQALDIIMQTKGLDMRKNGNVVLIAPREELATKEKLELEARQQIGELEPIHTELFQLNYKKAGELRDLLLGRHSSRRRRRGARATCSCRSAAAHRSTRGPTR